MSEKLKQAIDSNDSKVITQVRRREEKRVTTRVDRLHTILKLNDDTGTYDHDSISKIELCDMEIGLKEAWKNVQYLHDSFQHTREVGASATKESEIEKEQSDYIVAVEKKYSEGIKLIKNYNLDCEIARKKADLVRGKKSFDIVIKVVQTTLDSDDANVQIIASIVKEELLENFEELLTIENDFLVSLDKKMVSYVGGDTDKIDVRKEKIIASGFF